MKSFEVNHDNDKIKLKLIDKGILDKGMVAVPINRKFRVVKFHKDEYGKNLNLCKFQIKFSDESEMNSRTFMMWIGAFTAALDDNGDIDDLKVPELVSTSSGFISLA